MYDHVINYTKRLGKALELDVMQRVPELGTALREAWRDKKTVYLCGNGGSAGNAVHIANDFLFGAGMQNKHGGLRVEALSANSSVLTCLANDIGYENIFSEQLRVKANHGDVLIGLSGSGNSENVVRALKAGNEIGMKTFAVLAYTGGKCKDLAQVPIHFAIDDMQIAEDLQLIVGHMCMQWLCNHPIDEVAPRL